MEVLQVGAIVLGLTQVFKGFVPEKYSAKFTPLLAIILGALTNVYLAGYSPEIVMQGLVFGLSSTGLYKVAKDS